MKYIELVKLIDTTKCTACRGCQVACKQWNDLEGVKTELPEYGLGLQNPKLLSAKTYTVVTFNEIEDEQAPGGMHYVASKRSCMHCLDPACASACPVSPFCAIARPPKRMRGIRYSAST